MLFFRLPENEKFLCDFFHVIWFIFYPEGDYAGENELKKIVEISLAHD